jgi:hypothetical protein
MSARVISPALAGAHARVQARYGGLPTEQDWRRISGVRGLGAWLEEARNGPHRDWVKGFSAVSDAHDIEAGVRNLLFAEIDLLAALVPRPWAAAVDWTRWLPLLRLVSYLAAGGALPDWAGRVPPVAGLLNEAGELDADALARAGVAPLFDGAGDRPIDLRWHAQWRRRWPDTGAAVRAELDALSSLFSTHLQEFHRTPTSRAWGARQRLRDRLWGEFHRVGVSPAAIFIYLALFALDLERLRWALLDRSLFPESMPALAPERGAPAQADRVVEAA